MRAHGRPDLPAARDRPLCEACGATRSPAPRAVPQSACATLALSDEPLPRAMPRGRRRARASASSADRRHHGEQAAAGRARAAAARARTADGSFEDGGSPSRARRCARARPAEDSPAPAERIRTGLIPAPVTPRSETDSPAETPPAGTPDVCDPRGARDDGTRAGRGMPRTPRKALAPSSQSRPCERWRCRTMADLSQRAGAGADGGPRPPPRSRSTASKAPTGSVSSASRDDGRCRRYARRAGRARGHYDACRTGRNRPPGSRAGTSSLGAQTRQRRHRVGRRLCPPRTRRLRTPEPREFRWVPRRRSASREGSRAHRMWAGPRGPAPDETGGDRAREARDRRGRRALRTARAPLPDARSLVRFHGVPPIAPRRRQKPGRQGRERRRSGRPTLPPPAPRRGAGRGEARRVPPARCSPRTRLPGRHNHAIWSERKDTPTSPQPSPPLIHFPQAPGARSASLAFAPRAALGGGEGERAAPSTYPLRPSGGRGTGRGEFVVCAALCDHVRNLVCVRDHALTPATPYAAPTTLRACATLSRRIPLIPLNPT